MARFNFLAGGAVVAAAFVGVTVRADAPPMEAGGAPMMSGASTAPAVPTTNGTPMSNTNGPGKPAPPPPKPTDDFVRYGKILTPNDQAPYPFKLTMPGPGVGELVVPNPTELAMREKLEKLATLSDADIRSQLEQWPAFSKMSLGDQGTMLTRIQQFRDHRTKMALAKAHQLGLLTLNKDQQARFEQVYWDRRLQLDHQLAQQFEPAFKAANEKLSQDLFAEFSKPGALAQAGKPPAAPPKPLVQNTALTPAFMPAPPANGVK